MVSKQEHSNPEKTPEEKLLWHIKNSSGPNKSHTQDSLTPLKDRNSSIPHSQCRKEATDSTHRVGLTLLPPLPLSATSLYIKLAIVVSVLGLSVFTYMSLSTNTMHHFLPAIPGIESTAQEPLMSKPAKLPALATYKEISTKRNLFKLYRKPKPKKRRATKSIDIHDLVKHLTLSGVLIDETPQAVLTNTKDRKTHMVKAGEKVGDLTVKEIRKGKVTLEYDGQTVELNL